MGFQRTSPLAGERGMGREARASFPVTLVFNHLVRKTRRLNAKMWGKGLLVPLLKTKGLVPL
jgi:hypothetical protein